MEYIDLIVKEQPFLSMFLIVAVFGDIIIDHFVKFIIFVSSFNKTVESVVRKKMEKIISSKGKKELEEEFYVSSISMLRIVFGVSFLISLLIFSVLLNNRIVVSNIWIVPIFVLLISFAFSKYGMRGFVLYQKNKR